jgi:hypothetical protein
MPILVFFTNEPIPAAYGELISERKNGFWGKKLAPEMPAD